MSVLGCAHTPQLTAAEAVATLREGALLRDVSELDEWNAEHAAAALRNAGHDTDNLSGGMQAGQQGGGTVITSMGLPGPVT